MEKKHKRPDYVETFAKPKNTEIKYINGHWYLYERTSFYDPKTKRAHKKSGKLIGTITPTGLVHKREKLDRSVMDHIDVLELGASGYLFQHNRVLQERLRECFPELWRELFAISVLRITEGPRFKRLEDAYESCCLSRLLPDLRLDKASLSSILKTLGRDRHSMKRFMEKDHDRLSPYLVFDGHRIVSDSETLDTAQMGYDSKRRYKDQINLVYAFSISGERCFPYYYKQFSGDVPDITAFSSLVEEAGLNSTQLTLLADKGFGSEDNFSFIDESGFRYMIPIKRSNSDAKNAVPDSLAGYDDAFTFHDRAILHKAVQHENYTIHLFMDSSLFANELSDLTERLEKKNNTIALKREMEENRRRKGKSRLTDDEFAALKSVVWEDTYKEKNSMGTLAIRTNAAELNGSQVYFLYKRREAIENFFKTYDNSLGLSSSYMRDSYTEEAWLFLNHLSAIMAFSVMDEIYLQGKVKEYSLDDFISILSKVHADRINNSWKCAKMTKKRAAFAETFGLDIAALLQEMDAMDVITAP